MLRYVIDINLCRMISHNFKFIITAIIITDNKVHLQDAFFSLESITEGLSN